MSMKNQTFKIELTDTFGGEANYSWVRRAEFQVPDSASDSLIIRHAKRALGITGRHYREDMGETIALRFPGWCAIAFIDSKEN